MAGQRLVAAAAGAAGGEGAASGEGGVRCPLEAVRVEEGGLSVAPAAQEVLPGAAAWGDL